jgi:predicted PurR-regulated permease PerM
MARMAARHDPYVHRVVIAVGTAAAAVLLVLAVWASLSVLFLVFGGILLAVLLRGLGDMLSARTGIRESWSLWIVLALLAAILGAAGWYLSAEVGKQFDELGRSFTSVWDDLRGRLAQYGWGQQILAILGDPQTSAEKAGALAKFATAIVGGVSGLVVSVIIGLYMAADPTLYRSGFLRLVPMRHRTRMADVLDEMHDSLRAWLVGTLFLMIVVGAMTSVGLWALGIPLPLALGLIAFLLEFIPYIGPILAAIPAILVASGVGSREVLFVVLLYWAIQSIEGYLLSPLVFQRSIRIPPMLTIGSQVVLGSLLGVIGVIFATPLTACAMVLVQRLYIEDALGDDFERKLPAKQAGAPLA